MILKLFEAIYGFCCIANMRWGRVRAAAMSMRARVWGRHAAGLAGSRSRSRGVARGRAARHGRWGLGACGVRFERRARPGIGSVPSSVVPVWMEPWGQAAGRPDASCSRWDACACSLQQGGVHGLVLVRKRACVRSVALACPSGGRG